MGYDRRMGVKDFTVVRKKLERDIEQAEEDKKRKLRVQRLEHARAGISAYQKRRLSEAVKHFKNYIHVLEELNRLPPGGLLPTHFDLKKDLSELLMISGVYWDLVKLYDRTRSKERYQEFAGYLEKYVVFSKGMPFQHLCAEALRKYIVSEKPIHRDEFKNAYRALSTYKCFVASALVDVTDEQTIPRLRDFRDQWLVRFYFGRLFIEAYYELGPLLSQAVTALPFGLRRVLGKALDHLAKLLFTKCVKRPVDR
jgi:hypothetical protein